ncbi:Universal stress protein [Azospirillaceae bacterium]
MTTPSSPSSPTTSRVFLVVVDETIELNVAIYYACCRARRSGGRVAMLYVIEPGELQHWGAIENLMRDQQRSEAEETLMRHAGKVKELTSSLPIFYIREGNRREELIRLLNEDPTISILVLAASPNPEGPGPLISYLTGHGVTKLRIPLTIVPGTLTNDEINAIT